VKSWQGELSGKAAPTGGEEWRPARCTCQVGEVRRLASSGEAAPTVEGLLEEAIGGSSV
jgi:hypothetical protein